MHRLSVMRWLEDPHHRRDPGERETEVAVPVIDGVAPYWRAPGRYPGLAMSLVSPPSTQWLGGAEYGEGDRAVLLDGSCGVLARIELGAETVQWTDFLAGGHPPLPPGLRFESSLQQCVEVVAALPDVPAITIGG